MIPKQSPNLDLPEPSDVERVSVPTGPSIHVSSLKSLFGLGRGRLQVDLEEADSEPQPG